MSKDRIYLNRKRSIWIEGPNNIVSVPHQSAHLFEQISQEISNDPFGYNHYLTVAKIMAIADDHYRSKNHPINKNK